MNRIRGSRQAFTRRLLMEQLEPRLPLDASDLRITEFVASNDDGITDYDGAASDWLEIYNSGAEEVDLSGMYLSDSPGNLKRWSFPSGTMLPAGAFQIVWASNKNTVKPNGELHTNFALSAGGEFLALVATDGVTIIDSYSPEFPPQLEDVSYGRNMAPAGATTTIIASGAAGRAWRPTSGVYDATWTGLNFNDAPFDIVGATGFGYENNPGDPINYTSEISTTVPANIGSLYVRVPFNLSSLAGIGQLTLRMKYDDGFVAFVNGVKVADANAPDSPQWSSVATGLNPDDQAKIFQNFDVSAAIPHLNVGQNVLAIHALNQSTGSDMLVVPELAYRGSVIVSPETRGFFDNPTPGYVNGVSYAGNVARPTFSVPHGFYELPQQVSISTATPGSLIVYTTNGSTPAVDANLTPTNGTLYTGPITVSNTTNLRAMAFRANYKASFVATSTYLFLNDVINQSPSGQTPPGFAPNNTNGQQMDYGVDPDIINLYGAAAVKDSLKALPSISITTDLANLFDPATGIYVNAVNDGRSWERPASAELINPDGSPGWSVNAGLRIRGGYSRGDFNPKHAFRLYFRTEYGDSKLEYPMFGSEGVNEFDVLDLRTEQNYAWSTEGNVQNSFTREVFGRDLQGELGQPYTRSRYYHLYLDGQYWGVFMTQERLEEHYAVSYFGGSEDDYDVIKSALNDGAPWQVNNGNDVAWGQLYVKAQALANNPTLNAANYYAMQGLNPDGTRNPSIPVLLDVDNLIDYMLIIIYTGGFDSGISRFVGDHTANNWGALYDRARADKGFQFFIHDNEHSLGADNPVHGSVSIDRTGPFTHNNSNLYSHFNPAYLHQDLLAHPEYRQRVIDKVHEYMFNGGPMTPAASIARMQQRVTQVDGAIIAESARWGDAKVSNPRTKATWQAEINWLLNSYFPGRTNTTINQLRADGLNVLPPSFSANGGPAPNGFPLSLTAGMAGNIYYTTNGTDPRLVGGAISGSAQPYTGPVIITTDTVVKARLRTAAGNWSPLVEASFTVPLEGDYDGNSIVDGFDFLAWQRATGSPAVPAGSGADGNFDGVVNQLDLGFWANNFATTASVAAESASSFAHSPPTGGASVLDAALALWAPPVEDSRSLSTRTASDAVLEREYRLSTAGSYSTTSGVGQSAANGGISNELQGRSRVGYTPQRRGEIAEAALTSGSWTEFGDRPSDD